MTWRLFNVVTVLAVIGIVVMGVMFATGYMPLEGRGIREHERMFSFVFGFVEGVGLTMVCALAEPITYVRNRRARAAASAPTQSPEIGPVEDDGC